MDQFRNRVTQSMSQVMRSMDQELDSLKEQQFNGLLPEDSRRRFGGISKS